MIVGIDLGISTTKFAVLAENGEAVFHEMKPEQMTAERLEQYIEDMMDLGRYDIDAAALTGVGAKIIGDTLYKLPTIHVDEFEANALAAQRFIDKDRFIIASMGTGTSFVLAEKGTYTHIGGSALGGGTLQGMMNLLLPGIDFAEFRELTKKGDLANIDLQIKDVSPEELPNLPMDTTAANFGKVKEEPKKADLAAGLVNLVLQNIGVMANLAGKGRGIDTFCFIGLMSTLPQSRDIFDRLEKLYSIHIIVPEHPEILTALGAALKARQQPNAELQRYVETSILPKYQSFDSAHQVDHARMVIEQSLQLANAVSNSSRYVNADGSKTIISTDMTYAIAAYHDLGLQEDRKTHHLVSGRIVREDKRLCEWFTAKQVETMAQAVEDHRASSDHEPRSIYGKIVAEADRLIDTETVLRRTIVE